MSTIPSANTTPGYKYAVGTEFWSANRLVVCTVTKIASLSARTIARPADPTNPVSQARR